MNIFAYTALFMCLWFVIVMVLVLMIGRAMS